MQIVRTIDEWDEAAHGPRSDEWAVPDWVFEINDSDRDPNRGDGPDKGFTIAYEKLRLRTPGPKDKTCRCCGERVPKAVGERVTMRNDLVETLWNIYKRTLEEDYDPRVGVHIPSLLLQMEAEREARREAEERASSPPALPDTKKRKKSSCTGGGGPQTHLGYWNFIEPAPVMLRGRPGEINKRSGCYILVDVDWTLKFFRDEITVPKFVITFRGGIIGISKSEVTCTEAWPVRYSNKDRRDGPLESMAPKGLLAIMEEERARGR